MFIALFSQLGLKNILINYYRVLYYLFHTTNKNMYIFNNYLYNTENKAE